MIPYARKPGFTLIEVVLSVAISAMLFLGISSVLSASLAYSRDITGVVRFRQEQQRVYLALRNAFAEADRVLFSNASPNPRVILRNKSTSTLRPFTLIENPGGPDNRLVIQDFTLDPASPVTPTMAPRPVKSVTTPGGITVTLDPATNQVKVGNPGSPGNPCSASLMANCVLFNLKNNTLDFGITGNAPFVGAPLITDIKPDGTAGYVDILSPYEKREYRIRVTATQAPTVTFTTTPVGSGEFPYYYASGTPTTPAFSNTTSLAGTPPATKPFQVTSFVYTPNLTSVGASSPVRLDRVDLVLTDLTNTVRTANITIPVIIPQ